MYEATVVRIKTSPHPNADRLQLADAGGYSVIVGLENKDGDLGVLFPEGGQLDHDFCMVNELYRKNPGTGEPMGGYLDENRRIRALKLRGVESDALWLPMESLFAWLETWASSSRDFKEGDSFSEVEGRQLCQKYYTPATRRMMQQNPAKAAKYQALDKHYDTAQLRSAQLPKEGVAIITEKLHGTSGRTGYVPVDQPQSWLVRMLNKLPLVNIKPRQAYQRLSGTRNCLLDPSAQGEKGMGYRQVAHYAIAPLLEKDEVWYYEIVGYDERGVPIMAPHDIGAIGDSKLEKKLKKEAGGDQVIYHYGCRQLFAEHKVFVYRITKDGRELTMNEIARRVGPVLHEGYYIQPVPVLATIPADCPCLRERCDELTRGRSNVGFVPLREGICLRVEKPDGTVTRAVKHKSFLFCALEGIRKNDPDYVDTEEVA